MMRFNVIIENDVNEDLLRYISINATLNLTRVEGIINFVICKNNLYIPPIEYDANLPEISRYKKSIKF